MSIIANNSLLSRYINIPPDLPITDDGIHDMICFNMGSDVYLFGGQVRSFHQEVWIFKYDSENNEWIELSSSPYPNGVNYVTNRSISPHPYDYNSAYADITYLYSGGYQDLSGIFRYEKTADAWSLLKYFEGLVSTGWRNINTSYKYNFSLNDSSGTTTKFKEYDINADTVDSFDINIRYPQWDPEADYYPRIFLYSFITPTNKMMLLGSYIVYAGLSQYTNELFEYQHIPGSTHIIYQNGVPFNMRDGAVHFYYKGYYYFGLGWDIFTSTSYNDIWKYDHVNDSWTECNSFRYLSYAVAFVVNDVVYIGTGYQDDLGHSFSHHTKSFWRYVPNI